MPADSPDRLVPPIGGFFELHDPAEGGSGPSVLEAWTGGRAYAAFANARSAFAALAAVWPAATVWLPAFVCVDVMDGLARDRVRFYPVEEGFAPDLGTLEVEAQDGDVVLLAAHFGLPVGRAARRFAERRRDLVFIEDRAQALGPDLGAGADYALYSPRKLLGVADGGILVALDAAAPLPQPTTAAADADDLWRAPLLRHADPLGVDNARWHAANQAKEAAMRAGPEAITPRSLAILSSTSMASLAEPRLANWRTLDARLRRWSALPSEPQAPPLGYVLRLPADIRARLLAALHAERIFAAVHWPQIAAPEADFPREAAWTRELVTLPCDHRYGEAEMRRIADRVAEVLR
jgi:hypothetical protein